MGQRGPKKGWKGFRRSEILGIRLTHSEKKILKRLARASDTTPQEYVRQILKNIVDRVSKAG